MAETAERRSPTDTPTKTGRRRVRRRTTTRLPRTANIKLGLLITSVVIVLGTLYYSHNLVGQLREREYRVVQLFSTAVKYYAVPPTADDSLYRMITHYAISSGVPVILTDQHDVPNVHR